VERGATVYRDPETTEASSQAQISCGDGKEVSIYRHHLLTSCPGGERQFEVKSLPVSVKHHVEGESAAEAADREGHGVRILAPIGTVQIDAVLKTSFAF
jgi:hypothetical protein